MQIPVGAAKYRTGTLTVAPNFVEPDAATQKEIAADKEVKDRIFAHSADTPEWSGDFAKPVNEPRPTRSAPGAPSMASWPAFIAAWIFGHRQGRRSQPPTPAPWSGAEAVL